MFAEDNYRQIGNFLRNDKRWAKGQESYAAYGLREETFKMTGVQVLVLVLGLRNEASFSHLFVYLVLRFERKRRREKMRNANVDGRTTF